MSEPGRAGEPERFNSEMGFTHRIAEGLGLGWGWHAGELSVPGTTFPYASARPWFPASRTRTARSS